MVWEWGHQLRAFQLQTWSWKIYTAHNYGRETSRDPDTRGAWI